MTSSLKVRIKKHETLVGTLVSLALPPVAEMLAQVGFDWLWIDGEHGPLSVQQIQTLVQAAGPNCPCLIRIPEKSEAWIKQTLDIGAAGIIAPLVKTAEEARQIVQQAKYPPAGQRSIGIGRAHDYGMRFDEYLARANQSTAVVLQIEHIQAVENIEAIVAVEGIDAVVIGPYDLSGSLGKPGQVTDPEVQSCIQRVQQACERQKMPLGIFAMDPQTLKGFSRQGFTLLALGLDTVFLWQAAKTALEQLQQSLKA